MLPKKDLRGVVDRSDKNRKQFFVILSLCMANCYEGPFLPLIALRECDEFHFRNAPDSRKTMGSWKRIAIGNQRRFLGV
jgi:hypothetical protein